MRGVQRRSRRLELRLQLHELSLHSPEAPPSTHVRTRVPRGCTHHAWQDGLGSIRRLRACWAALRCTPRIPCISLALNPLNQGQSQLGRAINNRYWSACTLSPMRACGRSSESFKYCTTCRCSILTKQDCLQGCTAVERRILAVNGPGRGSGWQQSNQNWELLAVVGT